MYKRKRNFDLQDIKMNNSAVFIIGPAGTGKTTFCKNMSGYFNTLGRRTCVFNLDPGISFGEYHFSIHNKWPIESIMQEYSLGPNGGMIKCLELCANDPHWLSDKIDGYNDEIMFIDCPGQIEIYIHDNSMKLIMEKFKNSGYNICCLYLIDSTFIRDSLKYNSALLNSLSATFMLSVPFINIITKMDLLSDYEKECITDEYGGFITGILDETTTENTTDKIEESIQNVIDMFSSQTCLTFDKNISDDYYVISNYIDRMVYKDDDNYEVDL